MNAFKFSNGEGRITFGRYQIRPTEGEQSLPPAEAKSAQPDYLQNEIKARIHHDPVRFKLLLQVADKGDDLDDPSIAWPDTRIQVEPGILEITEAVSNNAAAERKLLFLPGALPTGIEFQDPMISARQEAYPVSTGAGENQKKWQRRAYLWGAPIVKRR